MSRAEARVQAERRLAEILEAAERKDFERLDGYHRYGPEFTKFSGESPGRLDAAATRRSEHEGLAAAADLRMRADDLKIDVFDDVAVATFILRYAFQAAAGRIEKEARSTLVLLRERGEWKIVHEHLSPISPGP